MTAYGKETPMIKNVKFEKTDTADSKRAVVQRIISHWRLKGEEAKLFLFYSSKPTGFCATQELIAKETGIGTNNINRARDKLVKHKFIDFSTKANTITLDWQVLKGLAWIPDDIDVRKGEVLPGKEIEEESDEDKKVREAYGLDLPDVNPDHLTFGCKLKPELFFDTVTTSVKNQGWIPKESGDKPVLFDAGVTATYDLPF